MLCMFHSNTAYWVVVRLRLVLMLMPPAAAMLVVAVGPPATPAAAAATGPKLRPRAIHPLSRACAITAVA